MPWCPKCAQEYTEGTETCSDCGEQLAAERPEGDELVFAGPTLLVSVDNDIEGDNVVALMKTCGIPAYCQHGGLGGFLRVFGGSNSLDEVNVYVPEALLPKALEAMEATGMLGEGQPLPDERDDSCEDDAPSTPPVMGRRLLLILVNVIGLILIAYAVRHGL